MKTILFLTILAILNSCKASQRSTAPKQTGYVPVDKNLYDTIAKLDSIFFGAYNTCDINLEKYASFYADDIEFYHDKGGVTTLKKDIVEATRINVCGKVTRQLVAGSIEVYPIANYGAVEIGYHMFRNKAEPPVARPHPGRFVVIWRHADNVWKITRVISLH